MLCCCGSAYEKSIQSLKKILHQYLLQWSRKKNHLSSLVMQYCRNWKELVMLNSNFFIKIETRIQICWFVGGGGNVTGAFDCSFACVNAPIVTTTSIILRCNKTGQPRFTWKNGHYNGKTERVCVCVCRNITA